MANSINIFKLVKVKKDKDWKDSRGFSDHLQDLTRAMSVVSWVWLPGFTADS